MKEFTVSFNFSAQTAQGITAQLKLTGQNSFLFDEGVQLRPFWSSTPLPPLNFVTVNSKSISITSNDGGKSGTQGITVTCAVSANGPTLDGDIPGGNSDISYSYQFVGHDQQGALAVGAPFQIPFPSS